MLTRTSKTKREMRLIVCMAELHKKRSFARRSGQNSRLRVCKPKGFKNAVLFWTPATSRKVELLKQNDIRTQIITEHFLDVKTLHNPLRTLIGSLEYPVGGKKPPIL